MKHSFLSLLLVLLGITAFAQPAAPGYTGNTTFCTGVANTFTATGAPGATFVWQGASNGGTLYSTSAQYTVPATTSAGGYAVYLIQTVNGQASQPTYIAFTVNQTPAPLTVSGPGSVTAGSVANLTASPANTAYVWTPNQGSSATMTGSTAAMVPTATTTYTATLTAANGCAATASTTVSLIQPVTVAGSVSVCRGGTTTLTASGSTSYTWYDAAIGGNTLSTAAGFTTPTLYQSRSYWVAGTNGIRRQVGITVSQPYYGATIFPSVICAGQSVKLRSFYSGKTAWYDAATGGTLLGTTLKDSMLTVTPAVTTSYYAQPLAFIDTVVFNPGASTWTVPDGVYSIQVEALGSWGGNLGGNVTFGIVNYGMYNGFYRGFGGRVLATIAVTPGQVLYINVGHSNSFNGGGTNAGAKGGGATDIRIGGNALTNRVLVAGGGGGVGYVGTSSLNWANSWTTVGHGGGLVGQTGTFNPSFVPRRGEGGTQSEGGTGYGGGGSFGQGGGAGYAGSPGGNGGGGWYGGGGGTDYLGGGGGGSSYTNPQYCADVSHTQGYWQNDGKLTISYGSAACGAPTTTRTPVTVMVNSSPSATLASNSACLGGALTVSSTIPAGSLIWKSGNDTVLNAPATWNATATTAAGGNGSGSALNQLSTPRRPFVTPNGDVYVCDNSNHRVVKWAAGATTGVVVAGGNGQGSAANQLNGPQGVYVDDAGTVYVADENNHRIAKWTAGATTGTTLFGGNGSGSAANQLGNPYKVVRDDTGNFYVVEATAHRVSKWAPGATSGVTVAGLAGSAGSALTQLSYPYSLALDKAGAIYIADLNGRIMKWAPGATAGTVMATSGSGSQSFSPMDIAVDRLGNFYVADQFGGRVQRWTSGSTTATTVALTNGGQAGAVQGVALDGAGNLYVADESGKKVQKFVYNGASLTYTPTNPGTYKAILTPLTGCASVTTNDQSFITAPAATIAGSTTVCKDAAIPNVILTGSGSVSPYTFSYKINGGATQTAISSTRKVRYIRLRQKGNGELLVGDIEAIQSGTGANVAINQPVASSGARYPNQNRVNDGNIASYSIWASSGSGPSTFVEIDLGAGGYNLSEVRIYSTTCCGFNDFSGDSSLELTWRDTAGVVLYTSDIDAYRGINVQHGTIVSNPLPNYVAVPVSTATAGTTTVTLLNTSTTNGCATTPSTGAVTTATVMVTPPPVIAPIAGVPCLNTPLTTAVTPGSSLQWKSGTTVLQTSLPLWKAIATTVAGGNGAGSGLNQLSSPRFGYAAPDGTFYASDINNHRVVRWSTGAATGVVVAGGNGSGNGANQLSEPRGVYVDGAQNVYVADFNNHRIQKWAPGATAGVTVAGTGISGATVSQLNNPIDVVLDDSSYLYISDNGNNRVQKWVPGAVSGITVAGGSPGSSLAQLSAPYGIDVDDSGAVYVADLSNNRVVKWPRSATSGTLVASGFTGPTDVAVDPIGNVYVSDQFNHRIQRWAPGATSGTTITGTGQIGVVHGVQLDAAGSLYVTDVDNNRIRKFALNDSTISTYLPTVSGTLSVVATSFGGCAATSQKTVETLTTATLSAPANLCKDVPVQDLVITGSGGSTPYTFAYTLNGGATQTVAAVRTRVRYVRVKQNANELINLAEIQAIEDSTAVNVALNKTATASSTLSGYPTTNINDGNPNNFWHTNAATPSEYIEIDLGAPGYYLSSVKITNRGDCCQNRSANLQLILKDNAGTTLTSTPVNVYQNQNNGYTSTYPSTLNGTTARITLPTSAAGAYKYKLLNATSTGTCVSTSADSVTVNIRPRAVIATQPAAAVTLCSGTSLTLTAAATGAVTSYQWRKNGTAITGATAAVYTKPAFPIADSGSYSVLALDSVYGCNDTSAASVVTTKLTPAFAMTGPSLVCSGTGAASVTFTSPNALYPTYTYTVNNGAAQTVTPAFSKVRYIRVAQNAADFINLAEIQAIDSVTGTNVALNKPTTSSSTATGYPSGNINDGSTAANNYWHSAGASPGEWVEIDLGAPGYNLSAITITNRGDCCQNRAANLQLTYKNSAGMLVGNETINAYQGQNSGYTASFVPRYNGYGVAVPTTAAGVATVFKAVTVTTPNGCSSSPTDSFVVTVKQSTVITTEPDTAKILCSATPLTLTVVADSAASYQWRKNGSIITGATAATYTNPVLALGDAGTYSVIAIGNGGCTDTSRNSIVSVKASPEPYISGTAGVCAGTTTLPYVYLHANQSDKPYTIGYQVNGGATQTVTAAKRLVRYVRIEQLDADYLAFNELQVTEAGTGTNIALGKTVTSSGTGYYPNSNLTDGDISDNSYWESAGQSNQNGNQYVEIDLGPQGYAVDSVKVFSAQYYGQPYINYLSLTYRDVFGGTITDDYSYNNFQSNTTQQVVKFKLNPNLDARATAAVLVPTTPSGTYTYKVVSITAANGCSAPVLADSAVVTVNPKAVITAQPAADFTFCQGSVIAVPVSASNALSYIWRKSGTVLPGAASATYSKAAAATADSGLYQAIAVGAGGCNDTSTKATVQINNVLPTATIVAQAAGICQGVADSIIISGTAGVGNFSYAYTVNGGAVQTAAPASVNARYVRVTQNLSDWTNLAEIRVFQAGTGVNVALNKTTSASNNASGYPAPKVVDGIATSGNYWHSANMNTGNWVEIDLGTSYAIDRLEIVNRFDCCQDRARDLQLQLKDGSGTAVVTRQINAYQNQNSGYTASFNISSGTVTIPVPTTVSGVYAYKLTGITSGGCTSTPTDSAVVAVNAKATINTQPPTALQFCTPNPLVLSAAATGATSYQWRKAGVAIAGATSASYVKPGASATDAGLYSVVAVGIAGCNDTSILSTITTGTLASMPVAATPTATTASLMQADGMTLAYTTTACEPIADVSDGAGGNVLGMVTTSVVKDATVQVYKSQPYLQRHWEITPASDGPATVTLYATQAEFDAFNAWLLANGSSYPKLPTGPADVAGIGRLSILQFHGLPTAGTTGPGGQYNGSQQQLIQSSALTTTWNGSYWSIRMPVSGFSGFFVTSGSSTGLPVSLLGVAANNLGSENEVLWSTASEELGNSFEVERSFDGTAFTKIGTVGSSGQTFSEYRLVDHSPATGINYYRIRAVSMNGAAQYSKVVSARVKEGAFVVEAFPNPTQGDVTVRLSAAPGPDALVTISDVSGKRLREVPVKGSVVRVSMEELAAGFYLLQYRDGVRTQIIKITKQ
ncbi:MAG: T9SS type A sorting domain-containing protein [Sphingobacteriales bacterium]|nr:MAG: T9SS type A sorting domain-containing protein [Sphingobacteriales bacterium]